MSSEDIPSAKIKIACINGYGFANKEAALAYANFKANPYSPFPSTVFQVWDKNMKFREDISSIMDAQLVWISYDHNDGYNDWGVVTDPERERNNGYRVMQVYLVDIAPDRTSDIPPSDVWYSRDDCYRWLLHDGWSISAANSIAEVYAQNLQAAYAKGWERAYNDKGQREVTEYTYYPQTLEEVNKLNQK